MDCSTEVIFGGKKQAYYTLDFLSEDELFNCRQTEQFYVFVSTNNCTIVKVLQKTESHYRFFIGFVVDGQFFFNISKISVFGIYL